MPILCLHLIKEGKSKFFLPVSLRDHKFIEDVPISYSQCTNNSDKNMKEVTHVVYTSQHQDNSQNETIILETNIGTSINEPRRFSRTHKQPIHLKDYYCNQTKSNSRDLV